MSRKLSGAMPMFALLIVIGGLIPRIIFWLATNWTIEDGMIVARIVRNFATHGELTFNLGERVSTATSRSLP